MCTTDVPENHILQCSSCSIRFHGICKKIQTTEAQCCKTFIEYFNLQTVKKPNFSWTCESCILKQDTDDKVTVATTVMSLATQVDTLTAKFDELKNELSQRTQQLPAQGNPWSNPSDVQRVKTNLKSSIIIKPNNGAKPDLKKIREIVNTNNLPVHNVGVSNTGNTFIHCASEQTRATLVNELQTEFGTDYTPEPLKDFDPTISIVGVTKNEWDTTLKDDDEKIALIAKLRAQNRFLDDMMNAGLNFNILFIKPPHDNYKNFQIVARISPKIRDAIRSNDNRLFIHSTSVRVHDRFYIKRCFNCNKFGHYREGCHETPSCGICAENHKIDDCPHKDQYKNTPTDTSNLNCINCKRGHLKYDDHTATSPRCPTYVKAQDKLRGNIPYYKTSKNMFGHSLH